MQNMKEQLASYFRKLREALDTGVVQSEQNIEYLVRVESDEQLALWRVRGIQKTEENTTLLEILGFQSADIDDHPPQNTTIGTLRYAPDYILKHASKRLAVMDVKAPDVNLDRWTEQIVTYCRALDVPLGILFSGRAIRVFINPEFKGLSKWRERFADKSVARADEHNVPQMIDILIRLAATPLQSNPLKVARFFAESERGKLKGIERKCKIQDKLHMMLTNPSVDLLAAIAALPGFWDDVPNGAGSPEEVESAWHEISHHPPSPPNPPRSINAQVREAVAEVIRLKGIDTVDAAKNDVEAKIRGLRFRGHGGNGFYPIPPVAGFNSTLYVAGVPAEDAKRIIGDLKRLV